MQDDPIVEEIRKIRDQLASEVDYDVRALGRKWQKAQKISKIKIVSLPAKPVEAKTHAQSKSRTRGAK